jgi:hypothetical protein
MVNHSSGKMLAPPYGSFMRVLTCPPPLFDLSLVYHAPAFTQVSALALLNAGTTRIRVRFLALPPREVGSRVSRKPSVRQAVCHSEYRGMNPLNTRCNNLQPLLLNSFSTTLVIMR